MNHSNNDGQLSAESREASYARQIYQRSCTFRERRLGDGGLSTRHTGVRMFSGGGGRHRCSLPSSLDNQLGRVYVAGCCWGYARAKFRLSIASSISAVFL